MAQRILLIGDFRQDEIVGQPVEALGKDPAADAEARLEILETPHLHETLAQDENGPAIADHRHGARERANLLVQFVPPHRNLQPPRSEEHTSELQSLMRISYAVYCLNKKT